jgi:cyclophilin family peptidyl-prolyl cis-trans isomerase
MFSDKLRILMIVFLGLVFILPLSLFSKDNPKVIIETNMGNIELELYPDKAPVSVENFLSYVKDGFYAGTIFHRVIDGFMIQGGGFDKNMTKKQTKPSIANEADNGLKNNRGTIAYARTNIIDSATSQFFINLVDNDFLNFKNKTQQGYGYAVFGKVTKGMKVVDKIGKVKTGTQRGMNDVPNEQVVILSVKVVEEKEEE